jgi:hypothetical protein
VPGTLTAWNQSLKPKKIEQPSNFYAHPVATPGTGQPGLRHRGHNQDRWLLKYLRQFVAYTI